MGILILNLLNLGHKWAAWLAKCRCVNYSTGIYYRFSLVLCCSSWHCTLVSGRTVFLSKYSSACVALKMLQSHKRALLLWLTWLCPLSHPWVQTQPGEGVSASACSLWAGGVLPPCTHLINSWWGFSCLFSLGNRILTFVGCQETSWIHLTEIHSQGDIPTWTVL